MELVDLLTEKEVVRAKFLFGSLDQNADGVVVMNFPVFESFFCVVRWSW